MADESTVVAEPESGEAEQQQEAPKVSDAVPAEIKQALRKANKEAETLRLKLKEYEDRDKTELQKLVERAEAAEREREALLIESMRARVALAKGLPPALADRLRGSNEEEMSADADALLALVPSEPARPPADVGQGVRSALPLNGDPLLRDLKAKLGIP